MRTWKKKRRMQTQPEPIAKATRFVVFGTKAEAKENASVNGGAVVYRTGSAPRPAAGKRTDRGKSGGRTFNAAMVAAAALPPAEPWHRTVPPWEVGPGR